MFKMLFQQKQIKYGIEHEEFARNEYKSHMTDNHNNFKLTNTWFIIYTEHPELGASPDWLVECDCCGQGCLEVKCPFVIKDGHWNLNQFTKMKGSCLKKKIAVTL